MNLMYLVKKPRFMLNRSTMVESVSIMEDEPVRFKNAIAAFFDRHLHEPEDLIQEAPEQTPRMVINDPLCFLPGKSVSPRTNLVSSLRALKSDLDSIDRMAQSYKDHVSPLDIATYGSAVNAYLHLHHPDLVLQLRRGMMNSRKFDGDMLSVVETLGFIIWVDKQASPGEAFGCKKFHLYYNGHQFAIEYMTITKRPPFSRVKQTLN
jgi:hypothetical protein